MNLTLEHVKNFTREELKFQTIIAGIKLEHPIMNGAGTCKLLKEVKELARSNSAAITVGSITKESRKEKSGTFYRSSSLFSLNSVEPANPGENYYQENLTEMVAIAHSFNKPLFLSVAAQNPTDYAFLTQMVLQEGADLVELNLSCPNDWSKGRQRRIPCFSPRITSKILQRVEEKVGVKARAAVKLSSFSDPFLLRKVARVINRWKLVKVVTTSNTFPNALAINEKGELWIDSHDGLASLGGPALRPISLGQIKQLRKLLPNRIDIVGSGGITEGKDVLDCERVGAVAVQITTPLLDRGLKVFDTLLIQLARAMKLYQP
jgi:dihydroorotate dehydrogenase (fumarate)